ncbi:MAG: outer membrane lipoprotein chaperone LolA [Pseudomonadota bacterium]|nr:outer membrane lipoprotein chaperone LolA [Pseudomonadota bacterium]
MLARLGGLCALILLHSWLPVAAQAESIAQFDRFFEEVLTFKARFTQTIFDENLVPLEESSGQLRISRPGRFRWDYDPPVEQAIVADGERMWVYDIDLEQVTIRKLTDALGTSPAAVLSSGGNPKQNYRVKDLGQQGKIGWVSLHSKEETAIFSEIQLGFERGTLRLIQLLDDLGQITRIVLSDVKENIAIGAEWFALEVPEGVDIIDEAG